MYCIKCNNDSSKVVSTISKWDRNIVWRTRVCKKCHYKYWTWEIRYTKVLEVFIHMVSESVIRGLENLKEKYSATKTRKDLLLQLFDAKDIDDLGN